MRAVAIAALLTVLAIGAAHAITDYDTGQIKAVRCYRGVIENTTGTDILCVAHYDITYNTMPAEDAGDRLRIDEALIGRFMNGTTEANSVVPVVYSATAITATTSPPAQGFGEGVFSFYWSAADASAAGVTWEGTGYSVQLRGNPVLDTAGNITPIIHTSIQWRDAGQTEILLAQDMLQIAEALEDDWSSNTVNVDTIESGQTILSDDGEHYLTHAIPNLQLMVPKIFKSRLIEPITRESTLGTSQAETYENFWDNSSLATGFTALANLFNVSPILIRTILLAGLMIGVAFASVKMTGRTDIGTLAALAVVLPFGVIIGMAPLALVFVVGLMAVLMLGFNYVYNRA